jgi:hypothetical protein
VRSRLAPAQATASARAWLGVRGTVAGVAISLAARGGQRRARRRSIPAARRPPTQRGRRAAASWTRSARASTNRHLPPGTRGPDRAGLPPRPRRQPQRRRVARWFARSPSSRPRRRCGAPPSKRRSTAPGRAGSSASRRRRGVRLGVALFHVPRAAVLPRGYGSGSVPAPTACARASRGAGWQRAGRWPVLVRGELAAVARSRRLASARWRSSTRRRTSDVQWLLGARGSPAGASTAPPVWRFGIRRGAAPGQQSLTPRRPSVTRQRLRARTARRCDARHGVSGASSRLSRSSQ